MTRLAALVALMGICACECGVNNGSFGGVKDGGQDGGAGDASVFDGGVADAAMTFDSGVDASIPEFDAGCQTFLYATVRDFNDTHPDFEHFLGIKEGIVQVNLGSDDKPVYGPPTGSPVVTSTEANFNQWYRDVPDANFPVQVVLPLTKSLSGSYVYDNSAFFPLDDAGFGNQGRVHNYHFTTELHLRFVYRGGEEFRFRGDDDVWVFINKRLALDLGGVHARQEKIAVLNVQAAQLGLVIGQEYALDVFHAERHTVDSNFRIETSIECLVPVIIN